MANENGEVKLELRGQTVILKPSVKALRGLSTLYPSLYELMMRVGQFNLIAICDTIQLGAGGDSGKDREILEEAVYEYGVQKISAPITEYLRTLMNGGRPATKSGEEGGEGISGKD